MAYLLLALVLTCGLAQSYGQIRYDSSEESGESSSAEFDYAQQNYHDLNSAVESARAEVKRVKTVSSMQAAPPSHPAPEVYAQPPPPKPQPPKPTTAAPKPTTTAAEKPTPAPGPYDSTTAKKKAPKKKKHM